MRTAPKSLLIATLVLLLAVAALLPLYRQATQRDTTGEDVYYAWLEGQRIIQGQNPYVRILAGNMLENQKYATYFPTFYWLSALTQRLGWRDYPVWIAHWRQIFLLFDLGIAALLYAAFYRQRSILLGVLAALFWLFNRWTLVVMAIGHIDFIPLFFLLASLLLFDRHRRLALLLFGLSLSIKQIAIFMVPLYLLWVWQEAAPKPGERARRVAQAVLLISILPVLASLPFLVWNAEGFVRSIVFSATRLASDHFEAPSAATRLGLVGIPSTLPMLGLLLLTCIAVLQRRIGRYASLLLTLAVFLDFNAVLFRQYMVWPLPFLMLLLCDVRPRPPLPDPVAQQSPGGRQSP